MERISAAILIFQLRVEKRDSLPATWSDFGVRPRLEYPRPDCFRRHSASLLVRFRLVLSRHPFLPPLPALEFLSGAEGPKER